MRIINLGNDPRFDNQGGKRNKYGNKKVVVDGITFDSQKEANRWRELKMLWRGKAIYNLKRQVKYELVPSIRQNGKVVQRAINYYADFVYTDSRTGEEIVEDVKGHRTDVYKVKKKLMLDKYGIRIREV